VAQIYVNLLTSVAILIYHNLVIFMLDLFVNLNIFSGL